MLTEIKPIEMPEWLSSDNFTFDVHKVLENSLFYPSAGFDGNPVKFFMGNVFSFVYVDYGVSRQEFYEEIENQGFHGYHQIYKKSISQNELIPNGWSVMIQPEISPNDNFYDKVIKKPFCEWFIFERNDNKDDSYNPKRFSFIYVCADGAAAYQAMYLSNNIKPRIIAIIHPGHGFGNNYTDFTDRDKIFAKSVFYNEDCLPEYLVHDVFVNSKPENAPIWDEYNKSVKTSHPDMASFAIWQRTEN
jgi:hypothetical protein